MSYAAKSSDSKLPCSKKSWSKNYNVVQIADRDDDLDQWPVWKHRLRERGRSVFLSLLGITLYIIYYRFSLLRKIAAAGELSWIPWAALTAELAIMVLTIAKAPDLFNYIWRLFVTRLRKRPRLRLVGPDVPTVDIIVPCCGEAPDIVLDTALAACHVNYPADRYRVIVSDDKNNHMVRQHVLHFQKRYPQLYYFAREHQPGVHHGFKAGNINATMRHAKTLGATVPDLCIVFDVDMIPDEESVRALVAPLVKDPRVAMAVLPQSFYNHPTNDPLGQSHEIIQHFDEPLRDAMGAAWNTGSGFVFRPEALTDIGGFPQSTLVEDVLSSTLLNGKGWQVVFVDERLQCGLVPGDFASHVKQRTKWNVGAMQNTIKLRFGLAGSLSQLTILQRISTLVYCCNIWSSTFIYFVALCIYPFLLLSGESLVGNLSSNDFCSLFILYFIKAILGEADEYISSLQAGYFSRRRYTDQSSWLMPHYILDMIREFLPIGLYGQRMGFTPSGSVKSLLHERDSHARAPLFVRLQIMLCDSCLAFNVVMLSLLILTTVMSITRTLRAESSVQTFWQAAFVRALWLKVPRQQYGAFLTPILYTLWPPSVPGRRELMEQDKKTGIWRPKGISRGEKYDGWKYGLLVMPFMHLLISAGGVWSFWY